MVTDARSVRAALRAALTAAMAQRDRTAMAVYRTAISAIDNAEAVAIDDHGDRAGAIESSALGVGRTEAERRSLSHADEIDIVRREIADRRGTADLLAATNPDGARELRSAAGLLEAVLAAHAAAGS